MLVMAENLGDAGKDEPWVKIVGKRTMLIPTLDLVQASVEAADETANVLDLRQTLAMQYGADSTCPVTVRRQLHALGIPVKRGTDRIKPRLRRQH